jgi:HEAT repeat protein
MTVRMVSLNLGALGLLIALLGFIYFQHTGARAVPGLIEDLQSEDRQAQQLAAANLKDIGPPAQPAVPLLVELATSDRRSHLRSEAARALPFIDLSASRHVMMYYLPTLQEPDDEVRRDAVSVLGALGPVAKPAAPSLLMMLNDPDTIVRDRVVRALGSIGLPADRVVRGLTQALRDSEWTVRHAAVTQFAFSGYTGPDSLSVVQELTKDPNHAVAQLAQSAVASAARPVQASTYSLMLKQGTDRTYPLQQLAKLGPRAAESASDIAALLAAEQPLERYLAACALAEIGSTAKETVPALRAAVQDPDPIVREAAAEALQAIEGNR